ncbi:hypothetical protein RHMOL_Rhmol01G0159800 [Rhododendron molle]|nr:hypothetical protein RHMOL_Rhmol01G0159800 [Rhododendron molle]
MDKVWLHQLFGGYGQVDDIYIPLKRSTKFNTKFGFIRFLKREEALNAVHALDGIVTRDFKLQVNLAKYAGNNSNIVKRRKTSDVPKSFPEVSLSQGIGFRFSEWVSSKTFLSPNLMLVALNCLRITSGEHPFGTGS